MERFDSYRPLVLALAVACVAQPEPIDRPSFSTDPGTGSGHLGEANPPDDLPILDTGPEDSGVSVRQSAGACGQRLEDEGTEDTGPRFIATDSASTWDPDELKSHDGFYSYRSFHKLDVRPLATLMMEDHTLTYCFGDIQVRTPFKLAVEIDLDACLGVDVPGASYLDVPHFNVDMVSRDCREKYSETHLWRFDPFSRRYVSEP